MSELTMTRAATPRVRRTRILGLLGPAFVAAVAYVDPGNVASNVQAGARYGYLLIWVLVLATRLRGRGAVPVGEARLSSPGGRCRS